METQNCSSLGPYGGWWFDGDDYVAPEPRANKSWSSPGADTGPVLNPLQSKALVEHGGTIYRRNRVLIPNLLKGDLPVSLPAEPPPSCQWLGPRIPNALFRTILAWFYQHRAGECQGKLFYHPVQREWDFEPLPQLEPRGMTTEEKTDDPRTAQILGRRNREGWVLNGTAHHHCGISAFQSGTDSADESDSNGLHFTIGKLNDPMADWHARYVNKRVTYQDLAVEDWIDTPDLRLADLPPYPKEWDAIFVKRAATTTTTKPATAWKTVAKPAAKPAAAVSWYATKYEENDDDMEEELIYVFTTYLLLTGSSKEQVACIPEDSWLECCAYLNEALPKYQEYWDQLDVYAYDWMNETGVLPVATREKLDSPYYNPRYGATYTLSKNPGIKILRAARDKGYAELKDERTRLAWLQAMVHAQYNLENS